MFSPASDRQKKKIQRTSRTKNPKIETKRSKHKADKEKFIDQLEVTNVESERREKKKAATTTKRSKAAADVGTAEKDNKDTDREKAAPTSIRVQAPISTRESVDNGGKGKKEKWNAEEAAKSFLDKVDSQCARSEFIEIKTIMADLEKCKIWKKNMKKNQNPEFPCLDSNIVKSANNPEDYVNASIIAVPHVRKPILVGQFPKKDVEGAIEEFWRIMFEENVMLIHILTGSDEVIDFFPQIASSYEHYGSMFVNNRKVERIDSENVKFMIEVLPTGFSNSNICTIIQHFGWHSQNVPAKFSKTIKSVIDCVNFTQLAPADEKALVISKNGVGRAGFFLSLASAISCLNEKMEPRIIEIVRSIREQRPMAVESVKQYTSLYLCVVYYIKKKIGDEKLVKKVNEINEAFKNMLEGAGTSVMT